MEYTYIPEGVCSQKFIIKMNGNIIESIKIIGGCPGNTLAVSSLMEGKSIDEVISKIKGIPCGMRGTSCPDQIAKALEQIKAQMNKN